MDQAQAQQDLAFIRELMQSARQATYMSGAFFIIWGLAAGVGLFGTWLLVGQKLTLPFDSGIATFWLWMVVDVVACMGTVMVIDRNSKRAVANPAGRLIGLGWFAVAMGLVIIAIVGAGSRNISADVMCGVSSLFIGIGVFNAGLLAGMKWVRNLAFGWWLGGAIMLASPGLWNLWFMALLLLLLCFIPGVMLSRKAQ